MQVDRTIQALSKLKEDGYLAELCNCDLICDKMPYNTSAINNSIFKYRSRDGDVKSTCYKHRSVYYETTKMTPYMTSKMRVLR